MNKSTSRIAAILFAAAALSGCGTDPFFMDIEANAFGAKPLIKPSVFQKIDLAALLNGNSGKEVKKSSGTGDEDERVRLENAFKTFNEKTETNDGKNTAQRMRNSVQERILAASNQRCGEYKNFLKAIDARSNFALGTLTTALAGAGAIFTGAGTVRALSGTASIFSGIRAEFNQNYFANQTIQVLTSGFEKKRSTLYEEMLDCQAQPYEVYNVEAAVKDAVEYHASCSLITGLEVAALAIGRVNNPGVTELESTLARVRKLTALDEMATSKAMVDVRKDQVAEAKKNVEEKTDEVKDAITEEANAVPGTPKADAQKKVKQKEEEVKVAEQEVASLEEQLETAEDRLALNTKVAEGTTRKLCKIPARVEKNPDSPPVTPANDAENAGTAGKAQPPPVKKEKLPVITR